MKSIHQLFSGLFSAVLIASYLLLSSCSSSDRTPAININYPTAWEYAAESTTEINIEKEWWTSFGSDHLTQLIDTALQKNSDVLIASEQVKQAELQMKIANASLFPSLDLSASSGERRTKPVSGEWLNTGSSSAGVAINYEVDLWGGIAASRRAAASDYKATVFSNEALRLSISAAVATAWFNYLALQERMATAQKNIAIAERIQKVVDSLYRNGVATAADVAQQKTNLLTQQTSLLPLQLQLDQTRSAIAILEGAVPQQFQLVTENFAALKIPLLNTGVPADIIARRPDVGSAEAQLQAASANVYAARTALLPSLQLGGNAGVSTSELFRLNPATQVAGWSVTLAQTLFSGGRIKNQIGLSESRRVELVEQYRQTILVALQEADDAINRINISLQQENNQQNIIAHAERSLNLIEIRYREGSNDLLSLLDAQRNLFQAEDLLVQHRLARLKATVDLYKALGGGWQKI